MKSGGSSPMRILLLNPCDDRTICAEGAPLFGLLSLGAYLKKQDYDVHGMDFNYPSVNIHERYLKNPENLVEEIRQFNPDVCGITTMTHTRYNAYYWAKIVKGLNKDTKVVLGGVHASAEPVSILKNMPQVDIVVIGEGEITIDELCNAIKTKGDLSRVKGIAYRDNGEVRITPSREYIENIDLLPTIDRRLFLRKEAIPKIKILDMMVGRGCPSRCKFCSSAFFWKGHRRVRSAKSVVAEIKESLTFFPSINFIKFRDETLLANKETAFEIMGYLKRTRLPWECWSRICDLDEEGIRTMKASGCWRVRIGIETGSEKLMRDLCKPVDLSKVPEVFQLLRKYRLKYSPSFILGLPGSHPRDIYATLDLIKKIKTDPSSCTISMSTFLFPGTVYFEDFKRRNPDFTWEATPERYRKLPCVLDTQGNYLFPIVSLPKGMPRWECHLLYIQATFSSYPLASLRRLFYLIGLFIRRLMLKGVYK